MVTGKSLAGKTGFIGNNTYGKSEKTDFLKNRIFQLIRSFP